MDLASLHPRMHLCFAIPPLNCRGGKPVLDLRLVPCPARLVWRAGRRGFSLLPWGVLKARDLLAPRHPSWAAREEEDAGSRRTRSSAKGPAAAASIQDADGGACVCVNDPGC